jgi:uncharacterized repeat protein (TIGR01451 family)
VIARLRSRTSSSPMHKETENVTSPRSTSASRLGLAGALVAAVSMLLVFAPSAMAAGPEWGIQITPAPTTFHRGEVKSEFIADHYYVEFTNVGDTGTSGPITVTDSLPPGLTVAAPTFNLEVSGGGGGFECTGDGSPELTGASELSCTSVPGEGVGPGETRSIIVILSVSKATADEVVDHATVSGGGAPTAATAEITTPVADKAPFAIQSFESPTTDEGGAPYTVAGGHPHQNYTRFTFPLNDAEFGVEYLKDAYVNLPNGFFGNPSAAPRCPITKVPSFEFVPGSVCPVGSIIGTAQISTTGVPLKLYNVKPEHGYGGQFAFNVAGTIVSLTATIRPRSEGYGLTIGSASVARLYGSPGFTTSAFTTVFNGLVSNGTEAPFLSNPVDCSDPNPTWKVTADSWENTGRFLAPDVPDLSDPSWKTKTIPSPPVTGCNDPALTSQWQPSIKTTALQGGGATQADQPTGLSVDLSFPQSNDPTNLNTTFDPSLPQAPEPKDLTVKLPEGLAISPSSASGLTGCSDLASDPAGDQVHYDTVNPVTCPASSKIGTVTTTTPLLAAHDPVTDAIVGAEPLEGDVYLLKPHPGDLSTDGNQNGTFRLLIQIESERYGINLKLPGTAVADKNTGQLTTVFTDNPQLPASHLEVNLKSGPRAPLATPVTCGTKTTTSDIVPWSSPQTPDATPSASFGVGSGPGGSACPASAAGRPFSPGLSAGTVSDAAGTSSPFVLKLTRGDGEQEISSLDLTLPKGFTAKLAGIPYCSDAAIASASGRSGAAELANPSCPAASRIGSVTVGAGPGSDPFYTQGTAYLAGPYKGAPLSFVFITPAVAGPFDLGDVVVRAATQVDPMTTQVTVKTDPIPQMLDGVPLRIRSLVTQIDRSDFTLNPTNCGAKTINATLGGSSGASASPSTSFQVAGCNKLAFKPTLKLSLKGSTKHAGHPALKAVLTYPKGTYANTASAQVNLPRSEFIDQANLNKTCTKPVLLAGNCPATTIYGQVKAWTPLLEKPLEGPVYLVGGYGYKLPALVAELDGQIKVLLVGKVDSGPNKGIRNTFEAVPDAPVEKFELSLKGGPKYSLLENSENLCKKPQKATATFTAQNGVIANLTPTITNSCGKKAKHHKGKKGKGKGAKHSKGAKGHKRIVSALLPDLGSWLD